MPKPTKAAAEYAAASPAFAGASDQLQDAIVALLDQHGKDGQVTLYPAQHAWIDGVERVRQTVPLAVAAGWLAHVPPPFYLDRESWDTDAMLSEPPFARDPEPVEVQPVRAEGIPDPFDEPAVEAPPIAPPPPDGG